MKIKDFNKKYLEKTEEIVITDNFKEPFVIEFSKYLVPRDNWIRFDPVMKKKVELLIKGSKCKNINHFREILKGYRDGKLKFSDARKMLQICG